MSVSVDCYASIKLEPLNFSGTTEDQKFFAVPSIYCYPFYLAGMLQLRNDRSRDGRIGYNVELRI